MQAYMQADMEKSVTEPKFFGRSAAATASGVSERTLVNYEERGYISPQRDSAARRLYTRADIEVVRRVRQGTVPPKR
jgi:MerR HTH family regulatory protein